jgi:hypothetical protein
MEGFIAGRRVRGPGIRAIEGLAAGREVRKTGAHFTPARPSYRGTRRKPGVRRKPKRPSYRGTHRKPKHPS